MRHAVALALIGAFVALGLWRDESYFLTVAGAVAAGYAVALWTGRKRR